MTVRRFLGPLFALALVFSMAAACPVTPATASPHSHPLNPAPIEISADGAEIVKLVNEQRVAVGCDELNTDGSMVAFADNQAKWMDNGGGFVHSRLGSPIFAENLSQGIEPGSDVVKAWLDSDEHKANMLNCSYTDTGAAFSGEFVVMVFGNASA